MKNITPQTEISLVRLLVVLNGVLIRVKGTPFSILDVNALLLMGLIIWDAKTTDYRKFIQHASHFNRLPGRCPQIQCNLYTVLYLLC